MNTYLLGMQYSNKKGVIGIIFISATVGIIVKNIPDTNDSF